MVESDYAYDYGKEMMIDDRKTSETIAWQLDTSRTVADWVNSLGWTYDNKEDDWTCKNEKMALIKTRQGFEVIKHFIVTTLNKDIATGEMEREQIERNVLESIDTLSIDLAFNMIEFGIDDFSILSQVIDGARKQALFHLSKSNKGFIMRLINEVRKYLFSGEQAKGKKAISDYIPLGGNK